MSGFSSREIVLIQCFRLFHCHNSSINLVWIDIFNQNERLWVQHHIRKAHILPLDCCAFYSSQFYFVMREHGFNEEVNCSFVAASEQCMCFSNMSVIVIPVWNLLLMTSLKFHSHAKALTQLFLSVSIDLQLWNRRFTSSKRPIELMRLDDYMMNAWWLEGSAQLSAADSLEGSFQDDWKGQQVCRGFLFAVTLGDKRDAPRQWRDICALNSQAAGTFSACSLSCRVWYSRCVCCKQQEEKSRARFESPEL